SQGGGHGGEGLAEGPPARRRLVPEGGADGLEGPAGALAAEGRDGLREGEQIGGAIVGLLGERAAGGGVEGAGDVGLGGAGAVAGRRWPPRASSRRAR